MDKKLFSEIIIILDKSGSMYKIRQDTIGGFNQFLEEQKKVSGKANFTLIQFDTQYNFVHSGEDIKTVSPLTIHTYIPNGNTALLDAVGRGIIETEQRVNSMVEKPDQVMFIIITDGEENSSQEFKRERIAEMVKNKQKNDKWNFVFLGANIDSFAEAGGMGISVSTTADYAINNMRAAYVATSGKISDYRVSNNASDLNFTAEDRKNLIQDDKNKS